MGPPGLRSQSSGAARSDRSPGGREREAEWERKHPFVPVFETMVGSEHWKHSVRAHLRHPNPHAAKLRVEEEEEEEEEEKRRRERRIWKPLN